MINLIIKATSVETATDHAENRGVPVYDCKMAGGTHKVYARCQNSWTNEVQRWFLEDAGDGPPFKFGSLLSFTGPSHD